MGIELSNTLKKQLSALNLDPEILKKNFADWNLSGATDCTVFGKDAFNRGSTVLRHIHMRPMNDPVADSKWKTMAKRGSTPTSDRYLFYANSGNGNYLLIYIVNNPGAHDFLSMPTASEKALLKMFEAAADQFYHHNKIDC